MPKRRTWGLRTVEVEVNAIIAKVKLVFGKKDIPRRPNPRQKSRVRRIVREELGEMAAKKSESLNVIADTIAEIASKERKRAIRSGNYDTAFWASIVEYYANEFKKASAAGL